MTFPNKDKIGTVTLTAVISVLSSLASSYVATEKQLAVVADRQVRAEVVLDKHDVALQRVPVLEEQVTRLDSLRKEELEVMGRLAEAVNKLSINVARIEGKVK